MDSVKDMQHLTREEDEKACTYAVQLVVGAVLPMTLKAAIELDLLEIVARAGPGAMFSPDDIVAKLPTENPHAAEMVDRILRLLAAYSIVSCSVETGEDGRPSRRYGPAPVCRYLTKNEDGVSLASASLMNQDKVLMESWYHLKDAVLEGGIPFNKAYGVTTFEYHGSDARFNQVFNECMRNHSTIFTKKVLDVYRGFDDVKVLVDVGGGTGATLRMITSRHPHIKGVNFDLPHVISEATPCPGVEHVSGDMFESVPSGGDAIFMKWILHDWSDEQCVKILRNCWKALPENRKVIVVECVLPIAPEATPETQSACQGDLMMLAYNPGGKERNQQEYQALANEAGFSGFKLIHVYSITWIMEFTK
ncbi:hypothetical protein C4D60_Mb00t07220 [Musa balbisiana]|uniref:O-methyltransferase domain-containing protein n=1 Tax=Musa balbisiana TaxID=52838 RepID=A0A4S8I6U8_MUSBA|nr:hypothetical protein C4D60_Mb00t07220 [Musa balbisiana]